MTQNTTPTTQAWYKDWFNTPYYHILYKDRDYQEAQLFIDNLTGYLNLPEGARVMDVACGHGRHSRYLHELGFDVTGTDLSEQSIQFAQQFEQPGLRFVQQDMRDLQGGDYDGVFNLFTSFGYFDDDADNSQALVAMHSALNAYGLAVLDFMNVDYVLDHLVPHNTKVVDGITFDLTRYEKAGYIYKEIRFSDKGQDFMYTERVKALRLADFEQMMEENGLFLLETFGDYKLRKFYKNQSERLILVFK